MDNNNFPNNLRTFYTCIALAFLIYSLFAYYSTGLLPWLFYNSDCIYIPYLYRDLVSYGNSITAWHFQPTPYFFPDSLFYFLFAMITQDLKLSIVIFTVFQVMLYYFLMVQVGKSACRGTQEVSLFRLAVLFSLLLLASGYLQQEIFYIMVSQEHFGAALMFLLGTWLILRNFTSENGWNYFWLGFICFFTTFSDLLFITQFVATAMACLAVFYVIAQQNEKALYMKHMAVIASSTLVSYLIYRLAGQLFHLHIGSAGKLIKRYHLDDLILASKKIAVNLTVFYEKNAMIVFLLITYVILAMVFISRILIKKMQQKNTEYSNHFIFTVFMLLMVVVTGYCSLIFLDNDLMDEGYTGMRHYQPFILFPVFLGIPLLLTRLTNVGEVIKRYYGCFILSLLLCTGLFIPAGSLQRIINFYPPEVECLDKHAQQYHLQNGLAEYWQAKSFSFLSKRQLNVVAVQQEKIEPYLWMNTRQDYKNKNFNFAVIKNNGEELFSPRMMEKNYGKPKLILHCPNEYLIYVYDEGRVTLS